MTVTKAVIEDLLPLYAAGEASDDTRRLVEEFLANDHELRERLKSAVKFHMPSAAPPMELETLALNQTRQLIARRNRLLGWAFGIAYLSFSFVFENNQMRFLLFRDWPPVAILLGTFGIVCWFLALHGGRRFRETGLAMINTRTPFQWFGGGMMVALPLTVTMSLFIGNWTNLITIGVGTLSYWMATRK